MNFLINYHVYNQNRSKLKYVERVNKLIADELTLVKMFVIINMNKVHIDLWTTTSKKPINDMYWK